MIKSDDPRKALTFSSREPRLREGVPESLRAVTGVRHTFDHARDPLISAQIKAMERANATGGEKGEGSAMVKREKPRPELKPKRNLAQTRRAHHIQCLKEHRRARLAQYRAQARERAVCEPERGRASAQRDLER